MNKYAFCKGLEADDYGEEKRELLQSRKLTEVEQKEILALVESLDTAANMDGTLMSVLLEQLNNYLYRDMSAEDAAAEAVKRIDLYIAE